MNQAAHAKFVKAGGPQFVNSRPSTTGISSVAIV